MEVPAVFLMEIPAVGVIKRELMRIFDVDWLVGRQHGHDIIGTRIFVKTDN